MDTNKVLTLTVVGIFAVAISLLITQTFHRKIRPKSENEGIINISYCIVFISWCIAFSLLNLKTISIASEYIDLVYNTNSNNALGNITKTSIIFIGITNLWLIVCHLFTQFFSLIIIVKKSDITEIENNHYPYFIIKGIIFISFVFCLMPIFEMLLRTFLPTIEIPFYH